MLWSRNQFPNKRKKLFGILYNFWCCECNWCLKDTYGAVFWNPKFVHTCGHLCDSEWIVKWTTFQSKLRNELWSELQSELRSESWFKVSHEVRKLHPTYICKLVCMICLIIGVCTTPMWSMGQFCRNPKIAHFGGFMWFKVNSKVNYLGLPDESHVDLWSEVNRGVNCEVNHEVNYKVNYKVNREAKRITQTWQSLITSDEPYILQFVVWKSLNLLALFVSSSYLPGRISSMYK